MISKKEQMQLLEFILLIDGMGDANSMVRLRFDKPRKKDWQQFLKKHLDIVKKIETKNN